MLFNHTASELTGLCGHALDLAKNMGAAAAEADFSESIGQSINEFYKVTNLVISTEINTKNHIEKILGNIVRINVKL